MDSPPLPSLQTVAMPAGWEHHAAPAATLLDGLGSPLAWWGISAVLIAAGIALRRRRPCLAVSLAVAASLTLALAANGLVDDAYIQFRYAANLAAGHGPVFNAGERIEGASGGVWIVLLGLTSAVTGCDPAVAGRILSLAAGVLATAAAATVGGTLGGRESAAASALLWAALPTPALYAATGLETTAFALALWALAAAALSERRSLAVAAGALVATLRPEGVLLGACALPFWGRLGRAARLALGSLLASFVLTAGVRLLYYGLPVPRSALVKGVTAAAGIGPGLAYLGQALIEWWPLLLAAPWIARRHRAALPVLCPVGAWTLLVVARGGDWMPGGRYLLPLLVLLVAGAGAALTEGTGRLGRVILIASVAWGLVLLAPIERPSRSPVGASWRAMAEHRVQSRWWESIGTWLRGTLPADATLASGPSGALPYAARLRTFDMFGLCSEVTHRHEGAAGHRLWGIEEAIAGRPDLVYPGQRLPQIDDWGAILGAARRPVYDTPGFAQAYRPLGIVHGAEYHLDLLRDVLWVRSDLDLNRQGAADRIGGRAAERPDADGQRKSRRTR